MTLVPSAEITDTLFCKTNSVFGNNALIRIKTHFSEPIRVVFYIKLCLPGIVIYYKKFQFKNVSDYST